MSVNIGGKGFIGVWEIQSWNKIGTKMFSKDIVTSFAISHDGKWLGLYVLGFQIRHIQLGLLLVIYSSYDIDKIYVMQWKCLRGYISY